jgi:3-phosphoshikimate 1-carboxyvinyltransferase
VLAHALRAVGLASEATRDALAIGPAIARGAPRGPVALDPRGDHRMAFAFALLGLCVDGISVTDPGCVAKSWPWFWSAMRKAGAACIHEGDRADPG